MYRYRLRLLCAVSLAMAWTQTNAQMCQSSGRECFSHGDCCGGCCRRKTCIDSFRLCSSPITDCESHYCPPGFSCSLYQLPNCAGCPIVPYCQMVQLSEHDDD